MKSKDSLPVDYEIKLQNRKATLKVIPEVLKAEFSGLDRVIDQVIDLVTGWYCFPEIQERPLVINLWGMTGTGKSSLVNRLAQLLDLGNRHYRFDMGAITNESGQMNIVNQLKDTRFREVDEPFIISFDEFQHARTLDVNKRETVKPEERIIWQLLDDGTFEIDDTKTRDLQKLEVIAEMLTDALREGVTTRDGFVQENPDQWQTIVERHLAIEAAGFIKGNKDQISREVAAAPPPFLPNTIIRDLYETADHGFETILQLDEHLKSLSTRQTQDFIRQLKQQTMQPRTIDCTKALIFVIGNLDEAYPVPAGSNPDMDPDHLHRLASRVTITDVKAALSHRFRSEEIARLGNNHILYPALRKKDFQAVIKKELDRLQAHLQDKTGIPLTFDPSLETLVQQEGIYPDQGTRPIFSTIHQLIYPLVSDVLFCHLGDKSHMQAVCLQYKAPELQALVYWQGTNSGDKHPAILQREPHLPLSTMRKAPRDDKQAIRAVHESGHAIGAIFLENVMPELICSVSAGSENSGFTYIPYEDAFYSRHIIFCRVAVKLGGFAAEQLIFGADHVTTGSKNDIESATRWLSRMLREWGLGPLPAHFVKTGPNLNNYVQDNGAYDKVIQQWIREALSLVRQTLEQEIILLRKMAQYLSDDPRMEKDQILDYCRKYGNGFEPWMLGENMESGFYRKVVTGDSAMPS